MADFNNLNLSQIIYDHVVTAGSKDSGRMHALETQD